MQNPLSQAQRIFADDARWIAATVKTVELRNQLGRKFTADDVATTSWLRLVGEQYARQFQGNFGYMVEMHKNVEMGYFLSARQVAGVLNCAIADWGRGAAQPKSDLPNVKDVKDARYRVVQADGSSLAIRLSPSVKDKTQRVLTYLGAGAEWTFAAYVREDGSVSLARSASNMRNSLKAALDVLVNATREGEWLTYALAFSREGNNCAFCGRDLDTLESIEAGYGPICADKYGLPWGQTSKPESVAGAESAPATEEVQDTPEPEGEPTTPASLSAGIQSQWKGHIEGTFESGRSILRKAGKDATLDDIYGPSNYRPGRSYEEIFGDD